MIRTKEQYESAKKFLESSPEFYDYTLSEKMNSHEYNLYLQDTQYFFNVLYEKLRVLEDMAEYIDWYSEKKVSAAKNAIYDKECADSDNPLYKRPAFSSDNQKPVYDRDGSIIALANIEPDGTISSNFTVLKTNNITAITKTSNADCYKDNITSFKEDGMYISEYRLDYPLAVEEILEVEIESPSDFNRVQYTLINSKLEYLGVLENNKVKLKLIGECMEKSKEAFNHDFFKGSNLDNIEESIDGGAQRTISSNSIWLKEKIGSKNIAKYMDRVQEHQKLKELNRQKDILNEQHRTD